MIVGGGIVFVMLDDSSVLVVFFDIVFRFIVNEVLVMVVLDGFL